MCYDGVLGGAILSQHACDEAGCRSARVVVARELVARTTTMLGCEALQFGCGPEEGITIGFGNPAN